MKSNQRLLNRQMHWAFGLLFIFGVFSLLFMTYRNTDIVKNGWIIKKAKTLPVYYDDDNLHSDWMFHISKNYNESDLRAWTEPIKMVSSSNGPGEMGAAFVPTAELKPLMENLLAENNYNLLASEMISVQRSLPDVRFDECKNLIYPEKLPTTSVIIIFHNEALSTLLRTVWSVINRSPKELIHEIILVDDASTLNVLNQTLDECVQQIPVKISVIRVKQRQGLIRARLIGAKNATGNVLTFLDAHVECTKGWLQPMLSRIASDKSVVAVPALDTISSDDMSYIPSKVELNGFHWSLIFNWYPIPERELNRTRNDKTAPLRTPTLVGCAILMDCEFFFEIGAFDEGMEIWGSENLELALRVWQCGGSVEIIPCSRVGHLFRISTYSFNGDEENTKTRNNVRLVEMWMDDFKTFFYANNPEANTIPSGDLSERQKLKSHLKCKNFRWYVKNIYPESHISDFFALGAIENVADKTCLDFDSAIWNENVKLYACHYVGWNQAFVYTKKHQLVTANENCVGINSSSDAVMLVECSERDASQLWEYDQMKKWFKHMESGLCLRSNQSEVELRICNATDTRFEWKIQSNYYM